MPAMKWVASTLRVVAVVMIVPAVCQAFGALKQFWEWLAVVTHHGTFVSPSTADVLFDVCRQLTVGFALLAIPLVLWIVAGLAPQEQSGRT